MKDFAKSIRTHNKAIYDDKGQFIIGYVEKEGSEYVAYTHGITGAKTFLLKASDEKTATDELKDYAKLYWKKQGNKKVGNEDWSDIIRAAKKQLEDAKKFGWAELGYNGWTKEGLKDFEKRIKALEERQKRENKTGNQKVGNLGFEYADDAKNVYEDYEYAKKEGDKSTIDRLKLRAKTRIQDISQRVAELKENLKDKEEALSIYKKIV